MTQDNRRLKFDRRKFLQTTTAAGIGIGGITAFSGSAAAATLTVDDDGDEEYSTIQAALADASSGDTIQVEPGTYTNPLTIDKDLDNLTLTGSGPGSGETGSTIDLGGDTEGPAIRINASGVTVEGFGITGAKENGNEPGQGIDVNGDSFDTSGVVLRNLDVYENEDKGVVLDLTSNALLKNVTARDNLGDGVTIWKTTGDIRVENVWARNNGDDGVDFEAWGPNNVFKNVVTEENPALGLETVLLNPGSVTVEDAVAWNNGGTAGKDIDQPAGRAGLFIGSDVSEATFDVSHSKFVRNNNGTGVYVDVPNGASVDIHRSNIYGNEGYGVDASKANVKVEAAHNWWGDETGPSGEGPGSGDEVSTNVVYSPWLTAPFNGNGMGLLSESVSVTKVVSTDLIADGGSAAMSVDIGEVSVYKVSDADNTVLNVTYDTAPGWFLRETHLHASSDVDYDGDGETLCEEIPTTPSGNPQVGKFAHQADHYPPARSFTYTLDRDFVGDDELCVAAHAEVFEDKNGNSTFESDEDRDESAWGEGEEFTRRGGSWAMHFTVDLPWGDQ